jgi:hypothetical protein
MAKWDPDQARDEGGRFASGGGGGGGGESGEAAAAAGGGGKALLDRAMSKGFTYRPMVGFPKKGFVVSIPGHESVYDPTKFTREKLLEYMQAHEEEFAADERNPFGAWRDTDEEKAHDVVVLDISRVFESEEEARRMGVEWKQKGIFDLAGEKYIELGADEGRVGSSERKAEEPAKPKKQILGFGHGATADEIWAAIQADLLKE